MLEIRWVGIVLVIVMVSMLPAVASGYHQFDPQNAVYTDLPGADVLDSVPKVASADYNGVRYVCGVWWHQVGTNWELRVARQTSEGSGSWSTSYILATNTVLQTGPEYTDIAISMDGPTARVAWTEQVTGPPTVVKVATNGANCDPLSIWSISVPAPDSGYNFYEPDLVGTDGYAYLARVRWSASSPERVQFVRLFPSVITFDITTNTGSGTHGRLPSLAAFQTSVVVAYQYCSAQCTKNSNIHVWSRRSSDSGTTWQTAVQVDTGGAPTPGGAPELASHGKQLHIVWQASNQILYERANVAQPQSFGQSWNAPTRFVVGTTFDNGPSAESKYALATFGYGVTVVYRTDLVSPPSTRRNWNTAWNNGETTAWQAPELLDTAGNLVKGVDVTVDARHEISGEKGNVVQYVWARVDGGTSRQDIYHRRIPTDERERQRTTFSEFTQSQGQSAVFDPSAVRGYIFGGEVGTAGDRIWRYDPVVDTTPPLDTGHRFPWALGYSSAIWRSSSPNPGAFIFYGRFSTGVPSGHICLYSGGSNPACSLGTPGPRYGTSAAYDGSRYAYVFGGKNAQEQYLSDILKFDTETSSFVGWGACATPVLPTPMAFSSAAWTNGAVFVFGGEKLHPTLSEPTNYYDVIKFDASALPCPTVTVVSMMPCPPWEACSQEPVSFRSGPGTIAVTVSTLPGPVFILIAGGRHLTGSIGDLPYDSRFIYSFDPSAYTFTLKLVDLPTCKALGSAIWYSPSPPTGTGRLYYFGGNVDSEAFCDTYPSTGGGNQVIRYDINTL